LKNSIHSKQTGPAPGKDRLNRRYGVWVLVPLIVLLAFAIWLTASAAQPLMVKGKDGFENEHLSSLLLVLIQVFLILGLLARQLNRKKTSLAFVAIGTGIMAWFIFLFWQVL